MDIKQVLFDLDGTLLPMNQDEFTKGYFKLLVNKLLPYGYDPEKLVESVWSGTSAMVKNNGKQSNEEAFWMRFCEIYGRKAVDDKPLFEEFYRCEFQGAKNLCGYNPKAGEMVRKIREMGLRRAAGMKVFLLTDCLLNRERRDINQYPRGGFEQLMGYIIGSFSSCIPGK